MAMTFKFSLLDGEKKKVEFLVVQVCWIRFSDDIGWINCINNFCYKFITRSITGQEKKHPLLIENIRYRSFHFMGAGNFVSRTGMKEI